MEERGTRPSLGRSIGWGALMAVACALVLYLVFVLPIYTLASFDPQGLDRPALRNAIFRFAIPAGTLLGLVCGVAFGRWIHRGNTWSTGRVGGGLGQRDDDPPVVDDWSI